MPDETPERSNTIKKHIIRNPFVERKYWFGAFLGLILATVAVIMDKYEFHVRLTEIMIAIQPGLGKMEQSMEGIGHYLYKSAAYIGIILTFACATPLVISHIAQIKDAMDSEKEK